MNKKQIIIIVVVLIVAAFIFWFKANYTLIKKPDQSELPRSATHEVREFPALTTQPGLDPAAESVGPTYPPPSSPYSQ